MRIWSISDIGLVRHENQDAYGTMPFENMPTFLLSNTMSEAAKGQ